jgi:hypothetical protein
MVYDWVTDREATLAELTKRFGHTDVYVRVDGKAVPHAFYVNEQAGVVRAYGVNHHGQRFKCCEKPGHTAWYQATGKVQVIAGKRHG